MLLGNTNKNKKFYWLKLKDSFFEDPDIKLLEAQENGKDYIIFYLKLQLLSLKTEGVLMHKGIMPYDLKTLATLTNTQIDTAKVAMEAFLKLNMVEMLGNGAYHMIEMQKLIGSESESAERVRRHREKALHCNGEVTKDLYIVTQRKSIENRDKEKILYVDAERIDEPSQKINPENSESELLPPKSSRKKKDIKARITERDIKCAEYLLCKIRENKPDYRLNFSEAEMLNWADEARLMFVRDKRTREAVLSVINWSQKDSFWKRQILSMSNLRDKFDRLELAMKESGHKSSFLANPQRDVSGKLKEFIPEEHGIDFDIDYGKWMDKPNGE